MSATKTQVVPLNVRVELKDVARYMGCKSLTKLHASIASEIQCCLEEAVPLLEPQAAFVVHDIEHMDSQKLQLKNAATFHGQIASFLQPSTRVAASVVTIGPKLERHASSTIKTSDLLRGYTFDAIGSAAADLTCEAFVDYLHMQVINPEESVTPPFSPGYCGLAIEQQTTLFELVDTRSINVQLNTFMMMSPIKSVSALVGIGPQEKIVERGVPCQWCDLHTCSMRRS